jgi:hypothetical protein
VTNKPKEEYRTLSTEIGNALSDRTNAATSDRITLRDAVCAYVAAERATGTTLDSVIQRVKDILRKAEEEAASATDATERRDDGLAQQLVDWCTEFHRTAQLAIE